MRNLNRIIFINSANKSVRYAEVSLDGNVHFIGTQGVGKSTLLRAILFFYNADKTKLGIPKEKKGFDEYYFPFQNSYIIYEVTKETGYFCIMAFKWQGRVAFRFFDAAYNKAFFIDNEGKAFENWDKTRDAFGKHINHTKIISSYEEYRNIVYGNNQGLSSEFRKYAVLESKQFQNIPRTIQNVFLNSKLEAEFIKETIIKSLNEEEIKIDLTTYSHSHLKDFERDMNDIKKWEIKSKGGESLLKKQADEVYKNHSAIRYLDAQKTELAKQLGWASDNLQIVLPKYQKTKDDKEVDREKEQQKINRTDELYIEYEKTKNGDILYFKKKLKDIKEKEEEYARINIDEILKRVSQKKELWVEKENLEQETAILTNNFLEINQRYEALIKQYENSRIAFDNDKIGQKNTAEKGFTDFKEKLSKQYDNLFEEIRIQQKESLDNARVLVDAQKEGIHTLRIKRTKAEHVLLYQEEISACKNDIHELQLEIERSATEIRNAGERRKNFEREGELEEAKQKNDFEKKIEKQQETIGNYRSQLDSINKKIENSKDSLYGWLNAEVPDWQNNIGKLIDVEVLFKKDLNPLKSDSSNSFYGVEIDTEKIEKHVKSVADYEEEKEELNKVIEQTKNTIDALNIELADKLDKLSKKYKSQIREIKEQVQTREYAISVCNQKLSEKNVSLTELIKKSDAEKKALLHSIDENIAKGNEELIVAEQNFTLAEGNLTKLLEVKKKEKESRIKVEEKLLLEFNLKLNIEIKENTALTDKQIAGAKEQQKKELTNKGADTTRIDEIDERLTKIKNGLDYIESNISIVERYRYDKEELFDKTDEFKTQKAKLEKQLESRQADYIIEKKGLLDALKVIDEELEHFKSILQTLREDSTAFANFKLSEIFKTIEMDISKFSPVNKTEKHTRVIIEEINELHYKAITRNTELKEAISKFTGNFSEENLFSFQTKFNSKEEYLVFAEKLKEFIDEEKINDYIKRVQERFANIIRQIGKETGDLITKEGEIHGIISDINKDFASRNFVGAIKSIELRTVQSANKIFQLLVEIKTFNDENIFDLGAPTLFSSDNQVNKNEKAIELLKKLIKEMAEAKENEIRLSDSFELQFRIKENDNDTDWVEKLANVGSDGTDILVKAMINIMLLNVFKEKATKKQKDDFVLHCMMDEIGKLHPNNVKGILKFANDRNIYLINSSPTSYNAIDYKYTYLLSKDAKNATIVKRLVKKI